MTSSHHVMPGGLHGYHGYSYPDVRADDRLAGRRRSCPPAVTLMTSQSTPAFASVMEEEEPPGWAYNSACTSLYGENSMEEPMQMSPDRGHCEQPQHPEVASPVSALTSALLDMSTAIHSPAPSDTSRSLLTMQNINQSPSRRRTIHGVVGGFSGKDSSHQEEHVATTRKRVGRSLIAPATTAPMLSTQESESAFSQEIPCSKEAATKNTGTEHSAKLGMKTSPNNRTRRCCRFRCIAFLAFFAATAVIVLYLTDSGLWRANCSDGPLLNTTNLKIELRKKVFGQHIAIDLVTKSLDQYLNSQDGEKPLVLSLHGWTGIGKTYLSGIVAEHVPQKCLHKIIIPLHFPHLGGDFRNGADVFRWITGAAFAPACCLSLFIVDEMDKADDDLVSGLVDAILNLTRTLEREPSLPKVVMVLLSNTGGVAINQHVLRRMTQGARRHEISAEEVVSVLSRLRSESWLSRPLEAGLITGLVPFLPLERRHVRRCLLQHVQSLGEEAEDGVVERTLDQLSFVPPQEKLFSKSGCRKVYAVYDLVQDVAET